MTTPDTSRSLRLPEFIRNALIPAVQRMLREGDLRYFGFNLAASSIELIGAALDEEPFHKMGLSEKRFNRGLDYLSKVTGTAYAGITGSDHDLFSVLRCGMSHVLRPTGTVAFTSRAEAARDRTQHLEKDPRTKKLIVVAEALSDHLIQCLESLSKDLDAKPRSKLKDVFLPITDFP